MASSGTGTLTRMWQRMLAAALAPALLAVGAAGCGGAGPAGTSAGSKANPLATLSAEQIARKAVADLGTAAAVHVTGWITDSGQRTDINLTLVHGKGCDGSISTQNGGSFLLIMIGTALWLKPDETFWKSAGSNDPAVLKILVGKYIKPSAKSDLRTLGQLCDPSKLFASGKTIGLVKGKNATISGQPALELKDAKDPGSAYVSISARPQVLRIIGTASNAGQIDFTGYGTPVTLTAPPASQTLDGAKYGF